MSANVLQYIVYNLCSRLNLHALNPSLTIPVPPTLVLFIDRFYWWLNPWYSFPRFYPHALYSLIFILLHHKSWLTHSTTLHQLKHYIVHFINSYSQSKTHKMFLVRTCFSSRRITSNCCEVHFHYVCMWLLYYIPNNITVRNMANSVSFFTSMLIKLPFKTLFCTNYLSASHCFLPHS